MPDEVRAEIGPWFIEKQAIEQHIPEKIERLDGTAKYVTSNLKVDLSLLCARAHVLCGFEQSIRCLLQIQMNMYVITFCCNKNYSQREVTWT